MLFLQGALISMLFFPSFVSQLGSTGAIIVNVVTALFLIVSLSLSQGFRMPNPTKAHLLVFRGIVAYGLIIATSMMVGVSLGNIKLSFRDFYEFQRPLFYILSFLGGCLAARKSFGVERMSQLLFGVFLVCLALGFIQFFRIADPIMSLYTKESNIIRHRVSAPFVNPYDYAFFGSFFVFWFISNIAQKHGSFLFQLLLLLSAFVAIFATQSRSVFVGLFVSLSIVPLFFWLVNFRKLSLLPKSTLRSVGLMSVIVGFVVFVFLQFTNSFPYLINSISGFLAGEGAGGSAKIRFGQWEFAMQKAGMNPMILLFGNGPAKAEMPIVESLYTYLIYRYGIVGLLLYFGCFIVGPFIAIFRGLRRRENDIVLKNLLSAFCLWILAMPILFIGNNFTEQVRLSSFYFLILGYCIESTRPKIQQHELEN